MKDKEMTINEKNALTALYDLNNAFFNHLFFDSNKREYVRRLENGNWGALYVSRMKDWLTNTFLKNNQGIVKTFQEAFNDALASNDETFCHRVNYLLTHHLCTLDERQHQELYDGKANVDEIMSENPNFGEWVSNGSDPSGNLLVFGLQDFGLDIKELEDVYNAIVDGMKKMKRFQTVMGLTSVQLAEGNQNGAKASTPLPVELQTDEAIKRFERAEKAGIIERTQTGYRKKGISKAMLAYFLQKVFLQDCRANALFPDKELSAIFNESRLGAAVTALINNRDGKPQGYKQIDDLFVD